MPRAFLMQYKKKPKVNVIYQEADTTEARQIMSGNDDRVQHDFTSSQIIIRGQRNVKTKPMAKVRLEVSETVDELMEDDDEEISVTDSEDNDVMQSRGCYDDSGCHEDEEAFQNEEEDDEEEEEEEEDEDRETGDDEKDDEETMLDDDDDDSENEEINVGDSEFGHIENQTFLYNQYQNFINQHRQQNLVASAEEDDKVDAAKDAEKSSSKEHGDHHKSESLGRHHSAFRKPLGQTKRDIHLENRYGPAQRSPMIYGPEFGTYMDARHPAVTNYWLHMSKMYNGNMPPLPAYPHPLAALPGIPLDHGPHLEALHKQMLHHNMLYIKRQGGMLPPQAPAGHPAMSMYFSPQHVPGMPPHHHRPIQVSPRSMVSPTSDTSSSETSQASSRGEKCTTSPSSNTRTTPQMSEAMRLRCRESSKDRGHVSPNGQTNAPAIRPTQQLLPYPFPPAIHPAQVSPSLHPMTSPPHMMTSSMTSPASVSPTSSSTFGPSPLNPYLYQGILGYGTRRPRDPSKPPPVKKYKCDICSKAFSRSNTLVTHRRIHTGEKPFKCEVCSRAFRQPGNLTRHRLTHTTVKPYVCVVCKKAFNRASNLHTHMRTHSNFRPFLCPYCGKSFQQKVDLKIHMYTHGGAPQLHG